MLDGGDPHLRRHDEHPRAHALLDRAGPGGGTEGRADIRRLSRRSVSGLSERRRREAAETLAGAMLDPLLTEAAAFRDEDVTRLLGHGAPRAEVERGLSPERPGGLQRQGLTSAREASGRLQEIIGDIASRHFRRWPT